MKITESIKQGHLIDDLSLSIQQLENYTKEHFTTSTLTSTTSTKSLTNTIVTMIIIPLLHQLRQLTESLAEYDHTHNDITLQIYKQIESKLGMIETLYNEFTLYNFFDSIHQLMDRLLIYLQEHVHQYTLLSTPLHILQRTIEELDKSFHHVYNTVTSHSSVTTGETTTSSSIMSTSSSLLHTLNNVSRTTLYESIRLTILTIDTLSSGLLQVLPVSINTPIVTIKNELHSQLIMIQNYIRLDTNNNIVSSTESSATTTSSSSLFAGRILPFLQYIGESIYYKSIDFTIEQYILLNHYYPINQKLIHFNNTYHMDHYIQSIYTTIQNYTTYYNQIYHISDKLLAKDQYYLGGKGNYYSQKTFNLSKYSVQYILQRYRILYDQNEARYRNQNMETTVTVSTLDTITTPGKKHAEKVKHSQQQPSEEKNIPPITNKSQNRRNNKQRTSPPLHETSAVEKEISTTRKTSIDTKHE